MKLIVQDIRSTIARVIGVCVDDARVYDYINQACRRLLHKGLWAGAYGRFTIHTTGGCITWPRQIETIEAIADCCGVGVVRNQWFEFQETGYGLLNGNQVCIGKQLIDRGTVVSYRDLSGGTNSYIRVYAGDASDVGKTITLQGVDQNGQWIRTQSGGVWIDGEKLTLEGRVLLVNDYGSLAVASGQSGIAEQRNPPAARVVIKPRDSVNWTLYYPPIIPWGPNDFEGGAAGDWQPHAQRSVELYRRGDLAGAFSALEGIPPGVRDPRFHNYRAALNLTVGQVAEAMADTRQALALDVQNGEALALQSVIATVQNEKESAYSLAMRAFDLAPQSPTPRVALSYAQQAQFKLEAALSSIREAIPSRQPRQCRGDRLRPGRPPRPDHTPGPGRGRGLPPSGGHRVRGAQGPGS